jgi:hypothetical protein
MSITQMFTIANRLYPGTNYYDLTREQRNKIMNVYMDFN